MYMLNASDVIEQLAILPPEEVAKVRLWLLEHEEDTPAMLAFIDEGLKSLQTEPTISLDDAQKKIRAWATRSS